MHLINKSPRGPVSHGWTGRQCGLYGIARFGGFGKILGEKRAFWKPGSITGWSKNNSRSDDQLMIGGSYRERLLKAT